MKNSGSRRIAERYVKALFEVAQAASAVDAVEKDMVAMGKILKESEDFQDFLTNPLLPRESQAEAMLAILAAMQVDQITRQFIGMLINQKRLAILPAVADRFVEWASAARGEMTAELVTAAPLKAQDVAQIGKRLGEAYGKKMNLEMRQDPALLGGVMVKIGSVQLDGSLAGKLNRLAIALKAA